MVLRDQIRPHIVGLEPYQPGKPIEELERELGVAEAIKLASNENPLGPSPRAIRALQSAIADVHRYPDGASFELRQGLARHLSVDERQLVFGCGGDEILELLAKTLLGPGDEVVYGWPSFAMYPVVARGMGAVPVPVPLDSDLVYDLPALVAAINKRTKLVFLCNPNNPTGTSVGAADFDAFVEALPADVVLCVDHAYCEYARRSDFPDALAWVDRRPGTIVLRTFSKIYGLAGMRIGYGVGDIELVSYLERARHPFNVNRLAEVAALAALEDDEHVEKSLRVTAAGIDYLERELAAMGIRTWPTDANFLLADAGPGVCEGLLRQGVIVRPMAGFGLVGHIRITIGTAEENERLIKTLRALREAGS